MIEPIDDDLRDFVRAYQTVERPPAAARAATWASIESRISDEPAAPAWRTRSSGPLVIAAIAAAVALCVGLAAETVWRDMAATNTAASHHRSSDPSPTATLRSAPLTPRSEPSTPRSEPDVTDAAHEREDPQPTPRSRPAPRRRPQPTTSPSPAPTTSPTPSLPPAPSLRPEEVASFQRAQVAQAEGDSAAALRALDEHGRRFPGGFFEEERLVSRAVALCKLGLVVEARATRDHFLRDRPASHLSERMRQTCREIE